MLLHRIHLNPRCREARRDLGDPYQLHATLCRAFSTPDRRCPAGEFLWRVEPETSPDGFPRLLVQSRALPNWSGIAPREWLAEADPAIDLKDRLNIDALQVGQEFRFRLRANPCVTRNGKRLGLLRPDEQKAWLARKGASHGFSLPTAMAFDLLDQYPEQIEVHISQTQMLRGRQHSGNGIKVYSVLYDGILTVTESNLFRKALQTGIGHAKALGLGLLSVAPRVG